MTRFDVYDRAVVRIQKRRNPLAYPMLAVFAFLALGAFGGGHPWIGGFLAVCGLAFLWVREDAEH